MSKTKLLIIDSQHAVGSTTNPNDFTVNINNQYLDNVKKVSLVGLRTINSVYNVNAGNNVIDYISGVAKQVVVPVGQYTATDFINAVNAAQTDFTLFLNPLTFKFEWTAVAPITIVKTDISAELIGLTSDLVDAVGGVTLVSQLTPDLSGLSIIYVSSSALGHSHSILSNSVNSNIISAVGVNSPFGAPIYYVSDTRDESDNHKYESHQTITKIDIQLLNHNYKPCQLQSNCHLIFKVYY